jgi:IclR family transcriptional regulator, pca regulon regulatory protein
LTSELSSGRAAHNTLRGRSADQSNGDTTDEIDENVGLQVRSLAKGLRILALFSGRHPEFTVKEIVAATGYPRPTAYRLLRTLEEEEYLVFDRDTLRYSLGPAFLSALYLLKSPSRLATTLHGRLESLAEETGEFVSLAIDVNRGVLIIDSASSSTNPFRPTMEVGSEYIDRSHGKIFAAYRTPEAFAALKARLQSRRPPIAGTSDIPEIDPGELAIIRRDGIAYDREELFTGLCAVASPVWDDTSTLVASVSCFATVERFGDERREFLAEKVKEHAMQMSQLLRKWGR